MAEKRAFLGTSHSQDVVLVETVANNPCLYDSRNENYKNASIRDAVWEQISAKLELPDDTCKNRWRNIRDSYRRNVRDRKHGKGSQSSSSKKKWPLYDYLHFLDKDYDEQQSTSSTSYQQQALVQYEGESSGFSTSLTEWEVEPECILEEVPQGVNLQDRFGSSCEESSTGNCGPSRRNKRKKTRVDNSPQLPAKQLCERDQVSSVWNSQQSCEPYDDTDLFFHSMALTVKKLRRSLQALAKKQICNLVMDLQVENEKLENCS